jgi:hypothetical protein
VLAAAGQESGALEDGRRAVELMPLKLDAFRGAWALAQYAEILAQTKRADSASVILRRLLNMPSTITTTALRKDPAWDPIRSHPAFRRLVQ